MLASPRLSGTGYSRASSGKSATISRGGDRDSLRVSHFVTGRGSASYVPEGPSRYPVAMEQSLPPAQQRLPSVSRSRLMQYGSGAVSPVRSASPRATPEPETLLRPPVRNVGASVSSSASPPFPGGRRSTGHPRGLFARVSYSDAPSTSPHGAASTYWDPVQKNSSFIPGPTIQDFGTPEPHSLMRSARKRGRPVPQDADGDGEDCALSEARSREVPQVSLSRREAAKGWVLSTLSRIPLVGSLVSASQEEEDQDKAKPLLSAGTEGGRDYYTPKADGLLAPVEANALLARSHASLVSPHAGKYGGGSGAPDAGLSSNCNRGTANFLLMPGCHAGERNLGGSPKCVHPSVMSSQGSEPPKDVLLEWGTPARNSLRSPTGVTVRAPSGLLRSKAGYPRLSRTVLQEVERVETASDELEGDEQGVPEAEAARENESPFFSSPLDLPTQWRSPLRAAHPATANFATRHQSTGATQDREQQEHQRVLSSLPVYASADEWQKDLDYILCMRDKFQLPAVASDLTVESGPGSIGGRETACPTAKRARRNISSGHRAANCSLHWDPLSAVAPAVAPHHMPTSSEYRTRAVPSFQTSRVGSPRWVSRGTGVAEATGSSNQNPFAIYNGSHQRVLQDGSLLSSDTALYGPRHRRKHRALRATDYRRLLRQAKFHSCKWIDYFDYVKARTADVEDYHHFSATATHKRVAVSLAEGEAHSNTRSSPPDSASATPLRRGSLLVADLPPPASAHRSLTFLDSQVQRKEDNHQRSSPAPAETTSAPSEGALSLGVDRGNRLVQQNLEPNEAARSESDHSQASIVSPAVHAPKSSGSVEKSDEPLPWWKANLGKPVEVSVEEEGFADNAQDEEPSAPKAGTGLSEGATNTFIFKSAIAGSAETPHATGSSSGALSTSTSESGSVGRFPVVDASAAKLKSSGASLLGSASSSPVFVFGKPGTSSSEAAAPSVSDNSKRPSLTLGPSTSGSNHSTGGSPLGRKRPSVLGAASLFSGEPAVPQGSLFGGGEKARLSSADQPSTVSSLFGRSKAENASNAFSGVTSASHKTGAGPSASLFGTGSSLLSETKKPTTTAAPETARPLFSAGSSESQKASVAPSSSTCSSIFALGSSQLGGAKEAPSVGSSASATSNRTAQDQEKKPSSLLMSSSLFCTTSTQQPTRNTPSSAAAQTPFLFGSVSSSNEASTKSQPAPASPSLFEAPSSSTGNQLRGSVVNAISSTPSVPTSGTHSGTSDNRSFGLFGATNLTLPKTSLFGTTNGGIFSAPGFGNASAPHQTGLADPTSTVVPQQAASSVGAAGSSVPPSEPCFAGSGLSGPTTFGSGTQQVASNTGLLGERSSADSQTNSNSTTTNTSQVSPFSTFDSRASQQQNGVEPTLPSSSTGSTVFGTASQPAAGSAGLFGLSGANAGSHSMPAAPTVSSSTAAQPSILPSLFGQPSSLSTSSPAGSSSILQHLSGPSCASDSLLQEAASTQGPSTVPPTSSSTFTFGATPANASPFGAGASVMAPPSTSTLFGVAPSPAGTTGTPADSSSTQLGTSPFSFGATSTATSQNAVASGSGSSAPGNHNPFAANAGSLSGGAQRRPKIRLKRTLH